MPFFLNSSVIVRVVPRHYSNARSRKRSRKQADNGRLEQVRVQDINSLSPQKASQSHYPKGIGGAPPAIATKARNSLRLHIFLQWGRCRIQSAEKHLVPASIMPAS